MMEWFWPTIVAAILGSLVTFGLTKYGSLLDRRPDWEIERRPTGLRIKRTGRRTAFSVKRIVFKGNGWAVEPGPAKSSIDDGQSDFKPNEYFDISAAEADMIRLEWIDRKRWRSDTVIRGDVTHSEKPTEITPSYI